MCPVGADSEEWWEFHSELDMLIWLKAGAEYRFTDHFGLRGSLGACLIGPSQICYACVGISHLKPVENPFQLDIQYGLIQAVLDVISPLVNNGTVDSPYYYWVPGACICVSYLTEKGHRFGIRAGGGVGLGYEDGVWRDDPFFLPNVALEYGYSFRK